MRRVSTRLDVAGGGSFAVQLGGTHVLTPARLFALTVDGQSFNGLSDPVPLADGRGLAGTVADGALEVTWVMAPLAGQAAWELGLALQNAGSQPLRITRMDPLATQLATGLWRTLHFTSKWGEEFEPVPGSTHAPLSLETRSGRSSHGLHPWLGLELDSGSAAVVVSPAWSGNWHIDVVDGAVSAGISAWQFMTVLQPGDRLTAPSVVLAVGDDLDDAAAALTRAIGLAWTPRSAAAEALPVEWNHWWPYEDAEVTEAVIWDNARVGAQLGVDVVTVDAGWFGSSDDRSAWPEQRGDWDRVNGARFPSGLEALGSGIREHGPQAGIWIEAEAVGASAQLRHRRPDILALATEGWRRDPSYDCLTVSLDAGDPTFLGYVCLGSPGGREHVAHALDEVVRSTGAKWVKLDFNVDPDHGCTRTDHGHGQADGLLRHYQGLYSVLDEFRARHLDVVLEACSSGGLRLDLELARHVHCLFLSDPDYTEHHLQVLWGASLLFPPSSLLGWSWSQWRGDHEPSRLDFATLTVDEFDTILRAALLHRFGISYRLNELNEEQRERIRHHITTFKVTIAPLVRDGTLRRLTRQPLRYGRGERVPLFQLSLHDTHLIAGFQLRGASPPSRVVAVGLDPDRDYLVTDLASGTTAVVNGARAMSDGIPIAAGAASSWLRYLEPRA